MFKKTAFALFALVLHSTFSFSQVGDLPVAAAQNPFGKVIKITAAGVISSATRSFQIPDFNNPNKTIFIFTRHAEKQPETAQNNYDPELTDAGKLRSKNLAKILSQVPLERVYSTQTKRTVATAKPTADKQNLDVKIYGNDHETLLDELLQIRRSKKHLIVGHSNTVPMMLNYLRGGNHYTELGTFDNLFVVVSEGVGNSRVFAFKY